MNVESGERQLKKLMEIAKAADVYHATFVNFGTLLGCVREGRLMPHDDDTDICIRADWITKSQEDKFYELLVRENMFAYRGRKAMRKDTDRFLWCSLRMELHGCKNCIWFCYPFNNYLLHSKGRRWLAKIGRKPEVQRSLPMNIRFKDYEAFAKGNTLYCFDDLQEVKLAGTKVHIPRGYGVLLDEYYPNWAVPQYRGASARHLLVLVKRWQDKDSWMVIQEQK